MFKKYIKLKLKLKFFFSFKIIYIHESICISTENYSMYYQHAEKFNNVL